MTITQNGGEWVSESLVVRSVWANEWEVGGVRECIRIWAMTGSSQGPFMTGWAGQGVYELGQWVETPLGRLGLLGLGGCGEVGGGSHWKCCVMMCSAKCSFPTVSCTRSRDHAACGSCTSAQTPWQGRVSSDKGRAWGAGGSGWWLEGAWWDAPDGDWWWWLEDAPEKWIGRISKSLVGSSLKIQTMNSRQFFCLSSWIQFSSLRLISNPRIKRRT